jgi:hypothetical protein
MTQENEHIRKLIAARDREVAQRRDVAGALGENYKRGHTENMRMAFISIQNTIEAIDRAIAHENYIASAQPGSIVAPILFGSSGASRFDSVR